MMDDMIIDDNNEYDTQYGVSVANINVNGFATNKNKRMQLNLWLHKYDIDVCCVQEWYKLNQKGKFDLDKSDFNGYDIYNPNTKTLIIYKNNLCIDLIKTGLSQNGLDATWIALIGKEYVLAIGSIYHSPSYECDIYEINDNIKHIKNIYNNKQVYININGDFNARNQLWAKSTDARGETIEQWTDKNNLIIKNDGTNTFINLRTKKRDAIDLSIVSENLDVNVIDWKVNSELYIECEYSDHLCLILEIDFNPFIEKPIDYYTWRFDVNKDHIFRKVIKKYMCKWNYFYNIYYKIKNKVDQLVELFQLYIFNAANEVYGIKKYNRNSMIRLTKREKYLRKQRHKLKRTLYKNKSKYSKKQIKIKRRKINSLKRIIRKIRENKLAEEANTIEDRLNSAAIDNSKEFYKLYNNTTKTNDIKMGPLKDSNDNIIATTKEEIAYELLDHFNKPLKENKYNENNINNHNKVVNFMKNYKFNRNQSNSVMNRPFTNQEVMKIIKNLNLNSAMAYDMIHYKFLDIAKYELVIHLKNLFNMVYCLHAVCPRVWRKGGIKPIPKPGRPATYSKNIRPISKLPGLCRALQTGVNFRCIYVCIEKKIIRIGNNAFQPNKNTDDIMLRMTEQIYRSFENKSFIELTFIDLKSAYDSVWIEGFFYKCIVFHGFDGCFIEFEYNYLCLRYNRVEFEGYITRWVVSRKCYAQGDPTSTTFFNIYMNDFKTISKMIEMSNFADDCSISTNSNDNMSIKLELNEKIEIRKAMIHEIDNFKQWTLDWKLIIAYPKCSTITFSRKSNKFCAYVYEMDGINIECIHAAEHAPPFCIHNKKQQYHNHSLLDNNSSNNESETDNNGLENIDNYRLNENTGNYEKIDTTYSDWSKYRMKTNESINLKKHVRILGLLFDPKLYWKEHINILIQKCKFKLHQLRQIAYCKYYRLSTYAIWKLWLTVIKPKIMYGICTYSSANDSIFERLESLQLEAARIALRLKKHVPRIIIYNMLNVTKIKDELKTAQIKLWNKYIRAPDNMIIRKTFEEWKEYIENNSDNIERMQTRSMNNNDNENENNEKALDFSKFRYIQRSPLSRAYLVIKELINEINDNNNRSVYRKIYNIQNEIIFKQRDAQVLKAPPIYLHQYPECMDVIDTYDEKPRALPNSFIFYVDGSCKPNPGPGGSALYSPNYYISSKLEPIFHDTTINYAELNSFRLLFESIEKVYNNSKHNNIKIKKNITIYTDSLFCCNLFKITGYTKYEYYYHLTQKIFEIINRLNSKYNIKIKIIKIKSHSNIKGNEIVDNVAKAAADLAVEAKHNNNNNESEYHQYYENNNPIIVDNHNYIQILKILIKKQNLQRWIQYSMDPSENNTKFCNEWNYIKMLKYQCNGNEFNFRSNKYLIDEYKFLNSKEISIINKLRTEHVNLNNYIYFFHEKSNKKQNNNNNNNNDNKIKTNGLCNICKCNENVTHFMLKCKVYNQQRKILFKNLRKINKKFREIGKCDILDVLFPHIWQSQPMRDDEYYKQKWYENIQVRVNILKAIVNYVKRTQRFNGEFGE